MLYGLPGSGKGTQATALAVAFGVPHIATGDIFRKNLREGTPLGQTAKGYMEKGQLVPDSLTCEMVADRLSEPDCQNGALLDGFPRSVPQAHWLLDWLSARPARVISLEVPEQMVVERISGRRVCSQCSTPYHVTADPPPPTCRHCGSAEIVQRRDDREDVVAARLQTYTQDTAPVLGVLQQKVPVFVVDGVGSVEDVRGRILRAVLPTG
jgi:adenylate kinase